MRKLLFFIFTMSLISQISAQPLRSSEGLNSSLEKLEIIEDTLGALGFLMVNDSLPEHRFGACKKFIPKLVKALKEKNSFSFPFHQVNTISILYPPDSSFRIFTWQLYVDKDTYHQYGAIQMNSADLKLFRLLDRPSNPNNIQNIQLNSDQWLGAVYYNIRQFDSPEGRRYLLFGLDGKSFFQKRKILDVLKFENGKPVFGAPVFVKNMENQPSETVNRIVLDYSAETTIRLNYDEHLEMIIFDHLIQKPSPFPGEDFTNLPDGSYEGYKLESGQWVYVEKIFHHKYERNEYPVTEPIDGKQKNRNTRKNILGNK